MMKPTLVIMAAGMGSRYGGLKQIESVGPSGELLIEYSIYDAVRAGFGKIIFVINQAIDEQFRTIVGDRIPREIPVTYAYQRLDDLPDGRQPPAGRVKPWGTAHAVYACREHLDAPFAVINADDFYGADAFAQVCAYLGEARGNGMHHCCMAGYLIENTLTEHGHVSRGVCQISNDGYLTGITERTRIAYKDGGIAYTEDGQTFTPIAPGTVVSMNMWGFPVGFHLEFEPFFRQFLASVGDQLKSEFFLPWVVSELLLAGRADVRILNTDAKWYGVTYREDREAVADTLGQMIRAGKYPERLWNHVG